MIVAFPAYLHLYVFSPRRVLSFISEISHNKTQTTTKLLLNTNNHKTAMEQGRWRNGDLKPEQTSARPPTAKDRRQHSETD